MSQIQPLFLDGRPSRLFCIACPSGNPGPNRRAVLVLPPFGEEMNRCRRMMSLAARALQARGSDVLVLDLSGTGDSEGEFVDASVGAWLGDLKRGAEWLRDRNAVSLDLLAVRSGALLVSDSILPSEMTHGRMVLWQPVTSGKQLVSQFLRLRVAAGLVSGTQAQTHPDPRALLRSEGRLEVSGYEVSEGLVDELQNRDLEAIAAAGWRRVLWCDVGAAEAHSLSPTSQRSVTALGARGMLVDAELFHGEPFWGTPEVTVVSQLVDRTASFLAPAA